MLPLSTLLCYGATDVKGESAMDPACELDLKLIQQEFQEIKMEMKVLKEDNIRLQTEMEKLREEHKKTYKVRNIEEEVQKNTEDIVDLRITDGRHDMLLSETMSMINYINTTIIKSLDNKVEQYANEFHKHDDFIDATRPPIGSIVAWMPAYSAKAEIPSGWQRCDGSEIRSGPMAGMATPDLNGNRLFMRGGTDESAGTVEDDTVQDHEHIDPGHTHRDDGHTHEDAGHSHDTRYEYVIRRDGFDHILDVTAWSGWDASYTGGVDTSHAEIETSYADIQFSNTGIGGMSTGRIGGETRPKNVNVVFIMRVDPYE